MNKAEKDALLAGSATGVQLCSFLALVAFFFAGLLLTKERTGPEYIQTAALALLFASAISFLFAALFYSNVYGTAFGGDPQRRQALFGNILSEFPGTYGLVFSAPLAVYNYSGNEALGILLLLFVSLGLFLYQGLGNSSSIIERYLSQKSTLRFSVVLCTVAALQLVCALLLWPVLFFFFTVVLWAIIAGTTAYCWSKSEILN